MTRRIYTVKLPTDGVTNVDIPVEGPFAGTLGGASSPTAVGADGFFAEWRNRPLRCPNKLSLGVAQFVPRFRLGFNLSVTRPNSVAGQAATPTARQLATGVTVAAAGVTTVAAGGPFAPTSATALLSVSMRVTDGVNVGGFGYGPGPHQVAPAGAPLFVSADLRTAAAGAVDLAFTNNDGGNAHTVAWTIWEIDTSSSQPIPQALCSQSLVGSVLTTAAGATTTGDGGLADPAAAPSIRITNGFDVAGALLRVYLDVTDPEDERS